MISILSPRRNNRHGEEEHQLLSLIPVENDLALPICEDEFNLEDLIRAIPHLGMEVYVEED